jgi:hypothetical protein
MSRRKSKLLSFRAQPELAARVERQAARAGVTVSDCLRTMADRGTGTPSRCLCRPQLEKILFETRLQNRYLYRLLVDAYGEEEVKENSAQARQQVADEVREIGYRPRRGRLTGWGRSSGTA